MISLQQIGQQAKACLPALNRLGTAQKNQALLAISRALAQQTDRIVEANQTDVRRAREKGIPEGMIDRLTLTPARIQGICEGVEQVAALDDPIGEVTGMVRRPNGLLIGQKRVPLGIIGIIYEARPNVTVDAAVLCLKSGNGVILRGGSEAITSNTCLVGIMQDAVEQAGLPRHVIQLVEDTSHETAAQMMRLNGVIDVLIPRGGKRLIASVVQNATVPVIETGTGNCHIYVDEGCDQQMALDILINAKTQRPSVCNAAESLVIHAAEAETFLPKAVQALREKGVEVRGCPRCLAICPDLVPATEEDFFTEYVDLILSVIIVDSFEDAVAHINAHNTKHSEAIITRDYGRAQRFLEEIDAAAVYVNASTRFTDGFEFGLGAEIGISTQKMHARGPMGLKALTTVKHIIYGDGQIRT
ncbi:MAG: glutamate-5-semialdehyde dehydrogenase [Eubacteriales bacterium]